MENLDIVVLRTLRDWRAAGYRALLATVVRTWGSSPRPVGSIMALCETGAVVGSVSGGCIEDDLIYEYTQRAISTVSQTLENSQPTTQVTPPKTPTLSTPNLSTPAKRTQLVAGSDHAFQGPPRSVRYGITADEAHRFGLPCGGTLELLLEFNPDPQSLQELIAQLEQGQLMLRTTELATGVVSLSPSHSPSELSMSATHLVNSFGPEYRMLLIGAGQMTEYLATMALFNGFAVTVCDPREEYRGAWSVPGVTLHSEMPDDLVQSFKPDRRSCVIALTHDPKLDDLALLEALQTEAFYIGAIGSRRNNQARHERLIEHFEQTTESLARLRGPIGIYIGSKTPAEIAVSIMAEVLAVKNNIPLPRDMDVAHAKNTQQTPPNEASGPSCFIPS